MNVTDVARATGVAGTLGAGVSRVRPVSGVHWVQCVRSVAGASAGVGAAGGGSDPRVTRGGCGRWGRGRVREL